LQTALIAFEREPVAHPGFQENSAKPCDTGSPIHVLREEFPGVDFGGLGEGWEVKEGEFAPDEESLVARAGKMRRWLREREEDEIVVVTHSGKDCGGWE
jgi:broad specificity phosphatase PhoE